MKFTPKVNIGLFIILASFWGGSFIAIKAVVTAWPPIFGAAMRLGIALSCLFCMTRFTSSREKIPFSLKLDIWTTGLFAQALPFLFLFSGEQFISPGLAGILNGTVPLWIFGLALLFFSQTTSFSFLKFVGLFMGMIGVVIIFAPLITFSGNQATLKGASLVLLMAICYAIGALLNQRLMKKAPQLDFIQNVYHQHWASFTFLISLSFFLESWPGKEAVALPLPWMAALYLGLFSNAIAYLIYYHLIRSWDALHASTVLYIVPILALVWDYVFFGNKPTFTELLGVTTILSGVIAIYLSNKQTMPTEEELTPLAE